MSTLRARTIRLAMAVPELRPTLLPILSKSLTKRAAAKKPVTQDIRHPMYEAGDKIGVLEDAVKSDPATQGDKALRKALADLRKAHDAVFAALNPYNWD